MECLRENKEGISQLKEDCMNLNQIERGTLTAAKTRADLPTTPITKYLRIKKEKSIDIWKQCVEDHFDDIVQELESEQAAATVTEQKHDPSNKDTTPQNKEHQELFFKSCSASFSNLVKDDTETTIQQFIVEQLRNTIVDATDYATSFEMRILRYFLILKDLAFEADNKKIDDIKLVKVKNIDIAEIIPQKFIRDDSDNLGFSLPPPLDKSVLNNDDVRKNYENFFSMSHFQLIHSTYFGPQGPKEATVNKTLFGKHFLTFFLEKIVKYQHYTQR
jgi:hypothetical protein